MRHTLGRLFQTAAWIAAGFSVCPVAVAQGAPTVSLQDQLQAQYSLVKMGSDSNGPAIIEAGTLLDIQKGGILGVPYDDVAVAPAKFSDGQLHPPGATTNNTATNVSKKLCGFLGRCNAVKDQVANQTTSRFFQVGQKVYPSKIEVNSGKDTVTLSVVSCDSCNNIDPPTYYKSEVIFQFAKGSLATTSPSQIEDTIAQVFTIDDNSNNNDQQNGGGDAQQGQGGGDQGQQQAQAAPQQEPQRIQLGQKVDDVLASMGKPEKIVDLGPKQIYLYKDLKITFVKGRVTDVE